LKPVIGLPPSIVGTFHDTVILEFVARSRTGAATAGGKSAQTKYYVSENFETPITFFEVILKP
jgi:hypothetical protein